MSKRTQQDWRKLANTPDYEDQFDEMYQDEIINESKQRRKEYSRGFKKEDYED